jgi:hypothetical protein
MSKYIVYIGLQDGIECETVEEVWKVIGDRSFGSTYVVDSETEDTSEFIPF